jgi:hypothetical protein
MLHVRSNCIRPQRERGYDQVGPYSHRRIDDHNGLHLPTCVVQHADGDFRWPAGPGGLSAQPRRSRITSPTRFNRRERSVDAANAGENDYRRAHRSRSLRPLHSEPMGGGRGESVGRRRWERQLAAHDCYGGSVANSTRCSPSRSRQMAEWRCHAHELGRHGRCHGSLDRCSHSLSRWGNPANPRRAAVRRVSGMRSGGERSLRPRRRAWNGNAEARS